MTRPLSEVPVTWQAAVASAVDRHAADDREYDREAVRVLREEGGLAALAHMAARYPDRIVIDDGRLRLSYSSFLDRVNGLARRLIDGWDPGSVIVALVDNSAAAPIAIMASALAGHILVPIDPSHPIDRQKAIFAQSGAVAAIFTTEDEQSQAVIGDLPRILFDPAAPTGAAPVCSRYDPDAPLFVAFTSGSTGKPKGLASGGGYGGRMLAQFVERYRLNCDDVVLGLASLSVGGSRDAFVPLSSGAKLRLCDVKDGFGAILQALGRDGVTILSFVPSALRAILAVPGVEAAFRTLRVLDLHGERILASDIALFREKLPPGCQISITMGSLESGAIFGWFVDDARIDGATVPVGYLLPGVRIALLDDDGAPVPDGAIGELHVRGEMAMGAWREGRLVPGPFLADPDDTRARIYNVGDLVRQRPDGLFEYHGRKDRQVKIRGLWANLGEVEAALRTLPGVADVAVLARGDAENAERLVAFLALIAGATVPSRRAIADTVAAETAEHMVPAEIHVLTTIPRLANFKLDLVRLEATLAGTAPDPARG